MKIPARLKAHSQTGRQGVARAIVAVIAVLAVFLGLLATVTAPAQAVSDQSSTLAAVSRYEQNDSRLVYTGSWTNYATPVVSGGSCKYSNSSASVTVVFWGTSFSWIGVKGPMYGIAKVAVDGGTPAYVDLYSPTPVVNTGVWSVLDLLPGEHVVTIEWTGSKNPSSVGTYIGMDAFDIDTTLIQATVPLIRTRYEQGDARLAYTASWTNYATSAVSGGSCKYSNSTGASMTAKFTGNRLRWIGIRGPLYGIGKITIDNGQPSYVDLYSPTPVTNGSVWETEQLSMGSHTVRIEWTGTKNSSATGTYIGADAFDVDGVLTSAAPLAFSSTNAMLHVKKLAAEIGVRRGGTTAELKAVQYAAGYLGALGYTATVKDVAIPNGLTSHNVVAVKKGTSPLTIVIGGHIDSKVPSPGGNDNASGAAAVLELARDFKDAEVTPTLIFVLFGNEEMIDSNAYHHHYGSKAFVAQMTDSERQNLVGMISLDMVGYGSTFTVRTMNRGPQKLRDLLASRAKATGLSLTYVRDTSSAGSSDHEPFELAGYPAVWLEWRTDPVYHTTGDTYSHVNAYRVQTAGAFTRDFVANLSTGDLDALRAAKN